MRHDSTGGYQALGVALRIERRLDSVRVFFPLVADAAALPRNVDAFRNDRQRRTTRFALDGDLKHRAHASPQRRYGTVRHTCDVMCFEWRQTSLLEAWKAVFDESEHFTGIHVAEAAALVLFETRE